MTAFNLPEWRGDTIRFLVTVTRNGSPVNLAGASMWFTAKLNPSDDDDDATTIQKTIGNGIAVTSEAGGLAVVTLEDEDTDGLNAATDYYCDVKLLEASGIRTTIATGRMPIQLNVTRAPA